jgi:hypothetical protein
MPREMHPDEIRLREWAKLAFRALNNVGPLLADVSWATDGETAGINRVRGLAEAAAEQYLAIAEVKLGDALADAAEAMKP